MEKGWKVVYTTRSNFVANLIIAKLKEAGINAVAFNKTGKSYDIVEELEVYTHEQYAQEALEIINQESFE